MSHENERRPPKPKRGDEYVDGGGNRFIYVDSNWSRVSGPEEELVAFACVECGQVTIVVTPDMTSEMCGSCYAVGKFIHLEGLELLNVFADHLVRQNARIIKERDQYSLMRKESGRVAEGWRDKYNDLKDDVARLADDPPGVLYIKDVLMTVLAQSGKKKGEKIE